MDSPQEFRDARRIQLQQQQQARSRLKQQKLKISFIGYTVVLVFLALLQFIGVFLFTKGFLLSRSVLPHISSCNTDVGSSSNCFAQPKFEKAVFLVIDALRFDFAIPVDPEHTEWNTNYHNNFPILHDLAEREPNNAVLLKFLADPPTTTLQRLKGLTTGSLPTFIDAGSNFNGDAIDEDNWILQLHKNNKSIAFMGDDTWTALFSKYMHPQYNFPYESLNVWDLHTVDNGVLEHLFPLLEQPFSSEWDVLIGHMLGVDHAGHRYGPDHYAMKEKLQQMNQVVQDTIAKLDDDTLLVVMGDHGMDRTGNHGGESRDEVESTIFFYTKNKNVRFSPKDHNAYNTADLGANFRTVNQIDLVPTISLLLGLPVPFNNLGFPIDEVFESEQQLAEASSYTIEQLARYRDNSKETQTGKNRFEELHFNDKNYTQYIRDAKDVQHEFLEHCKSLWARFDLVSISLGIAVLFLALSVVITYSRSIPSVRVSTMSFEFIGSIIAMSLLGLVLSLSIYFVLRPTSINLKTCLLGGAALGITIGFWAPIMDRFSVSWLWHQLVDFFVYNFNSWSLISLVFVTLHCLIFASNSYVVWEDKMVNFFISTFGFCCLYGALISAKPRKQRILGIMHAITFIVLTRIITSINLCREEQMPYCIPSFKTTRWSVGLLYLAALVLPKIVKSFYSLLESYHSAAPLWIETGLTFTMFMNAVYWTLELFENDGFISAHLSKVFDLAILKSFKLAIARIVLFASLVLANFSWSRGPLCVKIEFSNADSGTSPGTRNGDIDTSENLDDDEDSVQQRQPSATILGYGNVYGSSYFLLVLNLTIAVLLVTKPMGALSICILIVQILTLLELYDLLELRRNLIAPVIFGLLGYQHFFSTGHQAALPSIQWEVGFMTTQTIFFPFTHINIFLNTFGSFLIICLCIPLITLWKLPPSAKPITVLSQVVTNVTTIITYQILTSIMSFIFAANFRRHLMVWKIFAPRFMLSALLLIVLNITLTVFTTWFATGRVLMQVNRIFGK
ncbi:hypothetical protein JCM33374_g5179 [Metschnikowia sp. JCM 33374]|nr:hypothetical protein JCM33374_g5179 [Metschnikowia sp. JCM 33374]